MNATYTNHLLKLAVALALVVGLAPAATAQPQELVQLSQSDVTLEWQSLAGPFEGATLRVSGPGDLVMTYEFGAGENPFLSLFDKYGNQLADGTYSWEITVTPVLSRSAREQLQAARDAGDTAALTQLRAQAGLAAGQNVQSGYFAVRGGAFVNPGATEDSDRPAVQTRRPLASSDTAGLAQRDQVILDDLIVDGSACIGFDCVNGENFGFDTLRLKENNLRIKFQDTSNSASFPTVDWQITANESSSGGADKFSIDDIDAGRTPFTIEHSAPSNSLYVDDGGRVGLGTSTPVVDLHVVSGNTPTLRLEQNGTSGFTPQTWDVAGNETNFFIRDATGGSTLPFRIRPTAPSNSIYIDTDGDIGIGTSSPTAGAQVHIRQTDGSAQLLVEEASATELARDLLRMVNNGRVRWEMEDTSANGVTWTFFSAEDELNISSDSTAGQEFQLTGTGDLTITGDIHTTSCDPCVSDYVFDPDYQLMPLGAVAEFIEQNRHLPNIPSESDYQEKGRVGLHGLQVKLLEKVEELTLYTIAQEEVITELKARLEALEGQNP